MVIRLLALCVLLAGSVGMWAAKIPVRGMAVRAVGALYPAISPNGKSIAVSYQGAIGILPLGGGEIRIVSRGEGWDIWPTWSPGGKHLAFVRAPTFGAGSVKLISSTTGDEVKLRKQVWANGPIRFHPDGKRIFGKLAYRGLPRVIASYHLQTGEITPVRGYPDDWGTRRGAQALSPDGKWIYYGVQQDVSGEQGGLNGPQTDVYRLPVTGGEPESLFQWPNRIYHLCVAPKNAGLYVMTDHQVAHNDVWFLPANEPLQGARKMTHGIADEDWPCISDDGRTLVYTDNRAGATGLVTQRIGSGFRRELFVTSIETGEPVKRMLLKLPADESGRAEAWRVSVKRKRGKYHSPPGSMYHISAGLGHFTHRGDLNLTVPVGNYEIRVLRGPEYRMDLTEVNLTAGDGKQEIHSPINRWVDLRAEGWYSGENHIHANYGYGQWYNDSRSMLDMCEAEDLHVANLVVANSDSDAIFDREFFSGGPDPISTPRTLLWWNEEFRSTIWGHMTLFHLRQLVEPIMTGFKNTTNPWDVPTNGEILRRTRMQNGSAGYTHPSTNPDDPYDQAYSAKGLPVDAALGLVDCADVMGNVYPAVIDFWYRLLNAGFRLPASAGTDCFLNRVYMGPPGWGRVYVKIDGEFTYEKWVAGLKEGRSFVSNGPVVELTVNDAVPGDSVSLDEPGKVRIQGRLRSAYPIRRLEVIFNGKVIATGLMDGDDTGGSVDAEVEIPESGWLALRAAGKPVQFWWGREHGAHTNPVYVKVHGRPQPVADSARYFLEWIDRLENDLLERHRVPVGERDDVAKHLDLARAIYRSKLKSASGAIR
jgi:TolB protein